MTKAEILKREILSQYKSVRQFAIDMSIPYSTLVTALDRGIQIQTITHFDHCSVSHPLNPPL